MGWQDDPVVGSAGEGWQSDPIVGGKASSEVASPEGPRDYVPEIPSGAELTRIGRENTPAWTEAPSQAVSELVGGMVPHDLPSYFESVFPPAAAARLGTRLAQGDISGIPFAGRVPELIAAEETPAFSKERYLAGMKTLMDVGLLAGIGGNRIPSRAGPPPVPEWAARGPQLAVPPPSPFAGTTENLATSIRQAQQTRMDQALAEQAGRQAQPPLLTDQFAQPPQDLVGAAPQYDPLAAARWHQAVQAEMQPLIAQEYLMKKMGQPVPKPLADAIKAGNDKLQRGYQPPPETRFVIPAAQEPPPPAPIGPVRTRTQQQAPPPSPVVPQVAPQAAGPPPVPQEFTGAHHEALVSEYGPSVIQRGEVKAPSEYIGEARARAAKADPYSAASKVRSGQAITPEELADLVVEHDRLRQAATDAEKALKTSTNPQTLQDWNDAMQAKQDFAQGVLKPAATRGFGEFGRVLQEVEPADPATMTGASEIAQQRLNRELLEPEKKALSDKVDRTQRSLEKEEARAREAEASVPKGKAATREQMADRMAKIVKDLTPCKV